MNGIKIPTKTDLNRRFDALGIPESLYSRISAQIVEWTSKSGPEWTVKRLKALKTDFIQLLAGNEPTSQWIKYHRGVPKGPFGRLFKFGLKSVACNGNTPNRSSKALQALMVYTAYIASKETTTQLDKFYSAVKTPPIEPSVVDSVFSLFRQEARKLSVREFPIRNVSDYIPKPSKRCPNTNGTTLPDSQWLNTIDCMWRTQFGSNLYYNFSQYREVLNPVESIVTKGMQMPVSQLNEGDGFIQGFAGKIGHIQEPGLKLRAVANPFRVHQLALSRLGDQVYHLVKRLSWDCTHDQDAGAQWTQEKLLSGHTVHAVDLSNATDMFSLQLQIHTLKNIGGVNIEDINLFETLSMAPWKSPTNGTVQWERGQPLGLYPSFGVFTLTHGLLLKGIENLCKAHDSFRVLGDDVIISDPAVHTLYRKALEDLDIPVSEDKCVVSHKVGEFGGRVITHDSIMSPGKWRDPSDRSFLTLIANVGPRYIKYLKPKQQTIAKALMSLPRPIGLGWNPYGVPALDRWLLEEYILSIRSSIKLPALAQNSWPLPLMKSGFISHLFDNNRSDPLSGSWTKIVLQRPAEDANCRETLKSIIKTTGVSILPQTQSTGVKPGSRSAIRYGHEISTDAILFTYLEGARELATFQGLVSPDTTSDPRGKSVVEYWNALLKRFNSKLEEAQTDVTQSPFRSS